MDIRTCPHCKYKYPLTDYLRSFLFKFVWSEWDCKNCHKPIKFNLNRRIGVACGFGLLFIVISLLKENIVMTFYWWILFIVILIIGTVFIYTFDTFDKVI